MKQNNNKLILRAEKMLEEGKWKVVATSRYKEGRILIEEILKRFKLEGIFYHPNVLIERDGMRFFLIFSEKSKFVISVRKGIKMTVSGIDWFKFKLAQYIEQVTGIQVGLIMYSKETKDLVIRQMNQLPVPFPWFTSNGCLLNALKSNYKKPTTKKNMSLGKVYADLNNNVEEKAELTEIENQVLGQIKLEDYYPFPALNCMRCYQKYPLTAYRCIKGKHKSVKPFAVWDITEFETKKLTIQLPLLSYGK